jgi:hypothetical protein
LRKATKDHAQIPSHTRSISFSAWSSEEDAAAITGGDVLGEDNVVEI